MLVIIGVEDSNSLSKWLYHTSARDKATFVLESNSLQLSSATVSILNLHQELAIDEGNMIFLSPYSVRMVV